MGANTLLPVIALGELGIDVAVYASLGGLGACAGVLGAAAGSPLSTRWGLRRIRIAAALLSGASILPLLATLTGSALLPGDPLVWIAVHLTLSNAGVAASAVAGADLLPRLTPREQLGVVAGTQRTLTMGVIPISALVLGAVGAVAGYIPAGLLWCALALAAALPCRGLVDLPREQPPAPR